MDYERPAEPTVRKPLWIRYERIRCPACGHEFDAAIEQWSGEPFPRYVARCGCGHWILESEWEPVTSVR